MQGQPVPGRSALPRGRGLRPCTGPAPGAGASAAARPCSPSPGHRRQLPRCPLRAPPARADPADFLPNPLLSCPCSLHRGTSALAAKPRDSPFFLPRLLSRRAINKHAHPSWNVSSLRTFLATVSPACPGGRLSLAACPAPLPSPPAPPLPPAPQLSGGSAGQRTYPGAERGPSCPSAPRGRGAVAAAAGSSAAGHSSRSRIGAAGAAGGARGRRGGRGGGGGAGGERGCAAPLLGTAGDSLKLHFGAAGETGNLKLRKQLGRTFLLLQ